jgi:LysR family glycine cleavage system transcriptional activator
LNFIQYDLSFRAMAGPKTTLPPFAALRAFHAAATHDRYRDAAESLGLTESAISHQVKRLETFLRTPLIDRSGPRPTLTDTGRRYLEQIEPALRQIQAATEALMPAEGRATVRMTLPPSLAAAWLIPRLGAFEREHPEINLQLITTTRVIDLRRDQMDFAIRHGRGAWPEVEAVFLLAETATPVCAPGYVEVPAEGAAKGLPGELLGDVRLITNANFPDEWEEWSRAHGVEPPAPASLITMDAMEQALQLAASGHGLAMGRRPVVDSWLESGRLVAPFGDADPTGAAYYLCRPAATPPSAAARRFERWLGAQAKAWRGGEARS